MIKLFDEISNLKVLKEVENNLKEKDQVIVEGTDNLTAKIILVWYLANRQNKIIWLARNQNKAQKIFNWISKISDKAKIVSLLNNEREKIIANLQIYNRLNIQKSWILISNIRSFSEKIFPDQKTLQIKKGHILDLNKLILFLEQSGYERQERIILPGDYAIRGGIVDIFDVKARGMRVELFGDKVENIYQLNIKNQNIEKKISKIKISKIISQKKTNWLDNLDSSVIYFLDEPSDLKEEIDALHFLDLTPSWKNLLNKMKKKIIFSDLPGLYGPDGILLAWHNSKIPRFRFSKIKEYFLNSKNKIILVTENPSLIKKNFAESKAESKIENLMYPESLIIPESHLEIITEKDIFGEIKVLKKGKIGKKEKEFIESLKIGKILVHENYGLGKFLGKIKFKLYEKEEDYLLLEYVHGDRLFVPVHQIKMISKYVGVPGFEPKLSSLGTTSWIRLKKRVAESAHELARELLATESLRRKIRGFSFKLDQEWEKELNQTFKYEETPDQIAAILATYQDMESIRPMDRLVCGDVGFGKTEVAVRATLRAVTSGKQVAILAPTTILAEQHLSTFSDRLKTFPVKIESLSRFKSKSRQREIVEKIKNGQLDIAVGTHRLLQKDIHFKDLGLVVIDEEQQFGVLQKERLKKLRAQIDILTMTATPIPRTLYLTLANMRDISKIETSPEGRLPIITKISKFDEKEIKIAILEELKRGGQVYFIHNRIRSIYPVANKIKKMAPKAKIAIAYGTMAEGELANVMRRFSDGEIDILVSTSIVENGLDLPNVNTIIVDRADRFGLAELYHLRGRVGRGLVQAYAYLLVPSENLDKTARKRLGAILDAQAPGSGYEIAIQDLEMRGGGNILGKEQHGHMVAVGLSLYSQLLEGAIESLKNKIPG